MHAVYVSEARKRVRAHLPVSLSPPVCIDDDGARIESGEEEGRRRWMGGRVMEERGQSFPFHLSGVMKRRADQEGEN